MSPFWNPFIKDFHVKVLWSFWYQIYKKAWHPSTQISAYLILLLLLIYFNTNLLRFPCKRCVKNTVFVFFWTCFHTGFLLTSKKLHVSSHSVMTCNGVIILDNSFGQRSFALKFTINYWCSISTYYHYISIFLINQYCSYLIIFLDPGIQE